MIRARALALAASMVLGCAAAAEDKSEVHYMIHCMGCHLADGSGFPPAVPDVRGEMGRLLHVEGGRRYMVQVPGAAQAPVSDEELAGIVNYMARTFSAATLPDDFEPYTGAEVGPWREDWPTNILVERAILLERLEDLERSRAE